MSIVEKDNAIKVKAISYEETYQVRHEVMWPNKELSYIKLENDPVGQHFAVLIDEEIVSVISLFIDQENNCAQFRKFATRIHHQGNGYGGLLLRKVIDVAKKEIGSQSSAVLWCNARLSATVLYEKYGLIKTDRTFEKGGQQYVIMELALKGI